jgi:hypothetical protein
LRFVARACTVYGLLYFQTVVLDYCKRPWVPRPTTAGTILQRDQKQQQLPQDLPLNSTQDQEKYPEKSLHLSSSGTGRRNFVLIFCLLVYVIAPIVSVFS